MNLIANDTLSAEHSTSTAEDQKERCILPGMTDAESTFAMTANLPREMLEKLLAH